jgi:ATP-dependent Clp endopeptidase proteolytic subunit ClpP
MRNWKNDTEPAAENEDQKVVSFEKPQMEGEPLGNKIYFYTDISKDTILTLNKQIDNVTKQMKITQLTYNLPSAPPIEVHICSDGGDVFASMAAVDRIMNNDVPVHTFCEGVVASGATLLSVAGHKRFITRNSCMLIHQVSSGLWGNYMQFKDEMKNLELIMILIKSVYLKKSSFKEKQLMELLKHDLFLSAKECLKNGLVDEIL